MKRLVYKNLKLGVTILDDDYIVYKKLEGHVAQLVLPRGTRVMKSKNGIQKLRADKAIVLLIIPHYTSNILGRSLYGKLKNKQAKNLALGGANYLVYRMGKYVRERNLNTKINKPCGKGIHFFCTEKRARQYVN